MTLPIPIVVENFGAYYMEQKKRAVIAAKKQDLVEAKIAENAAGQMEMNQLASILQTKPFKTTPESPLDEKPHIQHVTCVINVCTVMDNLLGLEYAVLGELWLYL